MIPGEENSSVKRDSGSKKLISISLAPQLLDAFASRKATYVIRKNQNQQSPPLFDPNQRRKTTYYERCKMRRMQLYGNKSQVNLYPPTPPIEFEGPFLNVEVRVQSAPRSVRSAGLSALEVSQRDHSIQMQISMREHGLQIEVEKRSNQMQTTQKNFHEIAIETDQVEEELLEVDIDQVTQTDEIGLWFLKRGQKGVFMNYQDYQTQLMQNLESMSARTHNKSVQAKSKKRKLPVKAPAKDLRDPSPKNLQNPKLFNLLHNNRNELIQCSIDEDELTELQAKLRQQELERQARERELEENERERLRRQRDYERELMLRNAKPLMSGDPFYAQIRLKAESSENFPKENYDWRQSGLYEQIYKKYQDDKGRVIREAERRLKESSMPEEERKKREMMRDPGYRKAFGVVMIAGGGDNHDIVSIENSQDASSNFNMKKDIQEQELDLMNLNPNNEDIYNEMEVTYMAGLLKRKAQHTLDQVKDIHVKAISTLVVLTMNLIQGDTPLEQILTHYQEPTPENVTRLLLRCKKLYDSRVDAKKIIHSIILLQELVSQLKVKRDPALEEQTLILAKRLQSQMSNFKNENKIFKARFMFDQVDCYQWLPDLENQLTTGDFYIREKLKAMQEEQERLLQLEKARIEKERQELLLKLQQEEEERRHRELERRQAEEERRLREEEERRSRAVEVALQTSDKAESVKEVVSKKKVQVQTSPKLLDKPVKQFTFTESPSQNLRREESKTTLAMQYQSPPIQEEMKSFVAERLQSPPTPVIDRIALLRAQNVQTAAELSSRKEVLNHLTIPTMSTPEVQYNQTQSLSNKKFIQETAYDDVHMKTQMSNGTYAGPKFSSGPSDYRGIANSGLKIVEQKRPYYYEEPGEASSRQLTNIVSNYHDDRIYEVQPMTKPRNLTIHSPKVLSQSNTPKVMIGARYHFQNAPEDKDLSKSRYSVKTVPGGKSTQPIDEYYQHNTQLQAHQLINTMSASLYQSEDGVHVSSQKNNEATQQNLRYSQINSSINGKIITIQDQHQKQ